MLSHQPTRDGALLELELLLSADRLVYVTYSAPAGRSLPLAEGAEVQVVLSAPDQEGVFQGEGLVIRDEGGALIAALAAGGGLPPGSLGPTLEIEASRRLAYSESRQQPDLCLLMLGHHFLRVTLEGRVAHIAPGTWTPIQLNGRTFDLYAMDAARPVDARCGTFGLGNLSFAVLIRP